MAGETGSLGVKSILDKFYTNHKIAKFCIEQLDLKSYDLIIEPSAGDGSFLTALPLEKTLAYDLQPEGSFNIQKADWFLVDKTYFSRNSLVIGNPPFGKQNSLAIKFFNESAKFAKTIAFILPKSFKKSSIQDRLNLNFSLIKNFDLPAKSFLLNGEEYDIPTVFQIWERTEEQREIKKGKLTSNLIDFVKKDQADFRIQRVGGNAGKASLNLDVAVSSNYFIRNTSSLTTKELINIINELNFPSIEDTVGPKSLSKRELIEILEENLE